MLGTQFTGMKTPIRTGTLVQNKKGLQPLPYAFFWGGEWPWGGRLPCELMAHYQDNFPNGTNTSFLGLFQVRITVGGREGSSPFASYVVVPMQIRSMCVPSLELGSYI